MLSFVFGTLWFLFQVGVTIAIVGLLAYDAKIAYTYDSAQDIWEEMGKGQGVLQLVLFFFPVLGFFIIFMALDVLKPVFAMTYKAIAKRVKARRSKK